MNFYIRSQLTMHCVIFSKGLDTNCGLENDIFLVNLIEFRLNIRVTELRQCIEIRCLETSNRYEFGGNNKALLAINLVEYSHFERN